MEVLILFGLDEVSDAQIGFQIGLGKPVEPSSSAYSRQ